MTDDERLAMLFRAAADDAPPTGFDHGDVVSASRRVTARRRTAVVTAGLVVALAGIGAAVVLPDRSENLASTAAAGDAAPEAAQEPGTVFDAPAPAEGRDAGADSSAAAPDPTTGGAPPAGAPLGPGTTTCADRQDPALRALVEQVLPEVKGSPAAATTDVCLPGGQRHLALAVDDAGTAGLLTVGYLPPGTAASVAPGGVSAPTASGGTVVLETSANELGVGAPFVVRLDAVAAFLADRL